MGGFRTPNPTSIFLYAKTKEFLLQEKPDTVITGMALGYDQLVAKICIELAIPFVAAVPFIGQELLWSKDFQQDYQQMLSHAAKVEIVSPGTYASWKMQVRNQWICDHSDLMIAAFTGFPGGTKNCIDYAKSINKQVHIINPNDCKQGPR